MADQPAGMIAEFDRQLGMLVGLPDVTHTKAQTVSYLTPLTGLAQTFIAQTFRHREEGDTIFLQFVSADGAVRIVIPPKVTAALHRQDSSLGKRNRKAAARQAVETKRAKGQTLGNPEALAKARLTPRRRKGSIRLPKRRIR